jgi:hypothetical protein
MDNYKAKLLLTTILNEDWTNINVKFLKTEIKLYILTSYPQYSTKVMERTITSAQRREKDIINKNVLLSTIPYTTINKITIDPDVKGMSIDLKNISSNILGYYLIKFDQISNIEYNSLLHYLTNDIFKINKHITFEYRTKEQERLHHLNNF